jgi:hypothetical protein
MKNKSWMIHIKGKEDSKIVQEMYDEYFARLVNE